MTEKIGGAKQLVRRVLPPLVLILATVSIIALLNVSGSKSERQEAKKPLPLVDVQVVQPGNYQPHLELYGQVESPSRVVLSAAITAFVDRVGVREGVEVEEGELLLELDPRDAELQVLQSNAELQNADARIEAEMTRYESDLETLKKEKLLLEIADRSVARQNTLRKKGLGSRSQLDDSLSAQAARSLSVTRMQLDISDHSNRMAQLQAQRNKALAVLQMAELDLSRAVIRAPFLSRVIEVPVARGARVKPGDPLVALYAVDQLEARAQIPARYLTALRKSLRAGHLTQGSMLVDGQVIPITLDRMASSVSMGRGGVDALFKIDMSDDRFVEIGRSVVLQITLPQESDVIAIPAQSIYSDRRVYLVENQQLKAVEVEKVGEWRNGEQQWVLVKGESLLAGSVLMTTQLPGALTGMKVTSKSASSADAEEVLSPEMVTERVK